MKSHQFIAAALLASLGLAATAQTPAAPPAGGAAPPAAGASRHDPARMQQRMTQRLDNLKQKLQITPGQEGAWTAFTTALKPAQPMPRINREEFAQLTTPERIDRMRELRTQRMAEMDRRADATKTFYATLTPEQKKVFDTETLHGPWGQGMGASMRQDRRHPS